ncbi:hypothetical protein V2J09_021890, partial [Rumex salicifolius]
YIKLQESNTKITRAILSTIFVFYFVGFIYISVTGQIASLICMLEESYGFHAIEKSKELIKDKMGNAATIFVVVNLFLGCIHVMFDKFIVFVGVLFLGCESSSYCDIYLETYALLHICGNRARVYITNDVVHGYILFEYKDYVK